MLSFDDEADELLDASETIELLELGDGGGVTEPPSECA